MTRRFRSPVSEVLFQKSQFENYAEKKRSRKDSLLRDILSIIHAAAWNWHQALVTV
jgi:hypothetical protein